MLRLELAVVRFLGALAALSRRALRFGKDERGASMIEYALMAVAIIVVVGVGVGIMSDAFTTMFTELSGELSGAVAAAKTAAS